MSTWPVGPPSRDAARRLGDQHLRGKEAAVSTGVLSCFGAAFVGFHNVRIYIYVCIRVFTLWFHDLLILKQTK